MAKREILFNDEVYSIEESVIEASLAEMKSRLVDDYSGSGTTILYDGTTINVDSAKLAAAASNLAATLNKFAGSGASIVVNGVTYGIDSAKLNSAKANMGGTLSEMAGAAEEEDELQGTWVFNDNIALDSFPAFAVEFTNNGIDYISMSVYDKDGATAPRRKYFYYHNADIETQVYYSGSDTWYDETYRTIVITSKSTDEAFITWLKANATKQEVVKPEVPEEPVDDELTGTWVFNDTVDTNSYLSWHFNFNSGGKICIRLGLSKIGYVYYQWEGSTTYSNTVYAYTGVLNTKWDNLSTAYQTINVTSKLKDVVDNDGNYAGDTLLIWLKANATKQGTSEPKYQLAIERNGTIYHWEVDSPSASWMSLNGKYDITNTYYIHCPSASMAVNLYSSPGGSVGTIETNTDITQNSNGTYSVAETYRAVG